MSIHKIHNLSRSFTRRMLSGIASLLVLFALVAPVAAAPAPLQLVYDSIGTNTATGSASVGPNNKAAGKFFFPSIPDGYQLASANIVLPSVPTGTVTLSVWSDGAGGTIPGTPIGNLTSPGSFVVGTNTFTSEIILSPNRSYWLVLEGIVGSFAQWDRTTGAVTGPGASTEVAFYSSFGGGQWSPQTLGEPMMMSIYAVPEPSTWAMGIAGAVIPGIMALRRQIRRRRATIAA